MQKKSWTARKLALLVCLSAVIAAFSTRYYSTERQGDLLVQAIENYKAKFGSYPPSLERLETERLLSLSDYSQFNYDYKVGDTEYFVIFAMDLLHSNQLKVYSSKHGSWSVID